MKITKTLLAVVLGIASFAAQAEEYPKRPITWIVPFSAGGPTDALARDIANRVGQIVGQTIVIENVPGAGGTIGAAKASRATPDGYTFLIGHMGYMGAGPALYKKLPFDPVKDFAAVARFPDIPLVLMVRQSSTFHNVAELVSYAKANPGKLNFGNGGVGSTSHLVAALFASKANIDITSVSYKGNGPALADLMAGQVDAMFDTLNTAIPQLKGGKVRAIAITTPNEVPQLHGIEPLGKKAIPGFATATWFGLYAPRGTPTHAVDVLNKAYLKAIGDLNWQKRLAEEGAQIIPSQETTPQAFAKFTESEVRRWQQVTTAANISLD